MTDRPAMVIQSSVFGRHFLINEWNGLSLQGKQLTVFVANDKMWAFKQKLEKSCLIELVEILTNVISDTVW